MHSVLRSPGAGIAAVLILLLAMVMARCAPAPGDGGESSSSAKPVVFASVAPVAGVIRRLAGDRVIIETLAGPNQDPHGFSPTPKQLVALGGASMFFTVGMPFEERLVAKLSDGAGALRIVDVAEQVKGRTEEGAGDPHVWLSPTSLKELAARIEQSLEEIDPSGREVFRGNLETLLAELDTLDAELRAVLAPMKGRAFYVYHGAFSHFARAYDLKQEAIETGGRGPQPKRLFELIVRARDEGVRLIFVQPQFDPSSAKAIAKGIGGAVVPVNPMEEDVFALLRSLAKQVAAAGGGES